MLHMLKLQVLEFSAGIGPGMRTKRSTVYIAGRKKRNDVVATKKSINLAINISKRMYNTEYIKIIDDY